MRLLNKKAQVSQLPNFFQIMMLIIIFVGLTFIVVDKFVGVTYTPTSVTVLNESTYPTRVAEAGVALGNAAKRDCSATILAVVNRTTNYLIASPNYSVSGCTIRFSDTGANGFVNNTYWNVSYTYSWSADTTASNAINETSTNLYDYGVGFLGIVILVVMVYLIISIVSGRKSGAK